MTVMSIRTLFFISIFAAACSRPGTRPPSDSPGSVDARTAVQTQAPPTKPDSTTRLPALTALASVSRYDSAGRTWYQYVSQRYLAEHQLRGEWRWLIIHETSVRRCCFDFEPGTIGTLTATAYLDTALRQEAGIWQLSVYADAAEIWYDFYRTRLFGCCGGVEALQFFNLDTGKEVFDASAAWEDGSIDLPSIEVPNTSLLRWAAFHDRMSARNPAEAANLPDLVGVLQYGPSDGPTARVLLRCSPDKPTDYRFLSLAFRVDGEDQVHHSRLLSANGHASRDALSGFQIHLQLLALRADLPVSVLVPVERDVLALDRASVPEPCTLRHAPDPATPGSGGV